MPRIRSIGRISVLFITTVIAAGVGLALFWFTPAYTPLSPVSAVLITLFVVIGIVLGSRFSRRLFPVHNVAEVEVDGPITRDGGTGPFPFGGVGASANEIVELIESADDDGHTKALIVRLNTPGGQVVPSEDIRSAIANFDGPTVAYAEDMATSGGYWIASGADEIHARRGTIIGSIGVNAVQLGREELRDKLGLEYRRFVAGEYKDTPSPWRSLGDHEVEYVQNLIDEYYEQFVETVVAGNGLDDDVVRDTEARVYLGTEAGNLGLIDHCGPRSEMEDRLAAELAVDTITVKQLEPRRGPMGRLGRATQSLAYAFGAGITRQILQDDGPPVRI